MPDPDPDMHGAALRDAWFAAGETGADVLVVGGGVMGACVYHHLARAGLKVVLAERGDFACGTSCASAGLVWGGLLYLRHGHPGQVKAWCRERDRLVAEWPHLVRPQICHYWPEPARRNPLFVRAGLMAYGWLGGKPRPPHGNWLAFEEARLADSDARFTWHWIASAPGDATALNRCEATAFAWDGAHWQVSLRDRLRGRTAAVRARWVVNACGPWAKRLDEQAGVRHPWDLALSRGTSLVVPGAELGRTRIYEHPAQDDVMTRVPFGAHAVWGSTETLVPTPEEGFAPPAGEVAGLLGLHHQLVGPLAAQEVLAVRCGVRAMAVPAGWQAGESRSQQLSRRLMVLADGARPWLSLYGGKLSGCAQAGREVVRRIGPGAPALPPRPVPAPPLARFPGMDSPVPAPAWCRDREQCHTLADYLRRRTRIAQSVPRAGAGRRGENLGALKGIARTLAHGDEARAQADLDGYLAGEVARHDRLLGLHRTEGGPPSPRQTPANTRHIPLPSNASNEGGPPSVQ
jgi:glycerol-3-phosphate dehydrogenase